MYILLSTSFTWFHKFWCVVFFLFIQLSVFLTCLMTSLVLWFKSMLFNFYSFVSFPFFLFCYWLLTLSCWGQRRYFGWYLSFLKFYYFFYFLDDTYLLKSVETWFLAQHGLSWKISHVHLRRMCILHCWAECFIDAC